MHKRCYICCIAFFIFSPLFSQEGKTKKFCDLSRPEKIWVFFHPFIAIKVKHITEEVIVVAHSMKADSMLDGDENGGQVDAFRHAYWMASLAQHIKPRKVIKLGIAHEKGNKIQFKRSKLEDGTLPDSISSVMDLENNMVGIEIGKNNMQLNANALQQLIKQGILNGEMKVILKNNEGDFLDCQNNIINFQAYKGKWNIPKCLVKSNKIASKNY